MLRAFLSVLILFVCLVGQGLAQVPQTAELISRGSTSVERLPPVDSIPLVQGTIFSEVEQAVLEVEVEESVPEIVLEPAADIAEDADIAKDIAVDIVDDPWTLFWEDVSLWEGAFELGLTGSEGNSRTLNFHFGFEAERKMTAGTIDLDLDYHKKTADTVETAHRAFFDSRWEQFLDESPWTWFAHQGTEYDEFTAYDIRLAIDTGIGRELIETEATSLLGRTGLGCSREIGGPNDVLVPEVVVGLDFEQKLTDRQKLTASVDYTPDMTAFADFRLKSKAGWKVVLDEEMNLSLRVSVLDRYDSTPNGAEPNDLDYTVTLLWDF